MSEKDKFHIFIFNIDKEWALWLSYRNKTPGKWVGWRAIIVLFRDFISLA